MLLAAAALPVLAVLGLAAVMVVIRSSLQRFSDEAVARFPGGRAQALIAVVDCAGCDLQDRNHAVWALGQMVVEPALPTLRKYFDGRKCTHRTRLCQYELRKAIHLIESRNGRNGRVWQAIAKWHQPWK